MGRVAVGFALVLASCAARQALRPAVALQVAEPISSLAAANLARVPAAIQSAARMLRSLAQPDGTFRYEFRLADGGPTTATYNIVRHAGAIYALAMYEQAFPDPHTRDVIDHAAQYLVGAAKPAGEGKIAIYGGDNASLGGAGLGLVALLSAERVHPHSIDLELLRSIGRFIVFMQNPDGSFVSKFSVGGAHADEFKSLYYPGEAILALVLLYDQDRDPAWLGAALDGLRFLATSRATSADIPSDNWALVATEALLHEGVFEDRDRTLLLDHARQIVATNLSTQTIDPASPLFGCYTDDARTTPTSTHLEGLLAASAFIDEPKLAASEDAGIAFLLDAQITDGPYAGAVPAASLGALGKLGRTQTKRNATVRIDYVQHALSAFLRYRASRLK
jgi:hypothetical protein